MATALYTDLTEYYDLMCADIDYQDQCNTAHRLHKLFGAGGNQYLDLACGTGPHVEHFLSLGYFASGLDLNGPMLDKAALRCPQAIFHEKDMSDFAFTNQFDLITCFLYSLHYCYPRSSYVKALSNAFNALKPGGVLCFDMVDKNKIANDAGIKHGCVHDGAVFEFQSRWHYSTNLDKHDANTVGDLSINDELSLYINISRTHNGEKQFWEDRHCMLAVTVDEVQVMLETLGFSVNVFERDFSRLLPWNGESGNVFIAAVKP